MIVLKTKHSVISINHVFPDNKLNSLQSIDQAIHKSLFIFMSMLKMNGLHQTLMTFQIHTLQS